MEASQVMGFYHIEVANYEDCNKLMNMMGKDRHDDHHADETDIIGSESTTSSSFEESNISKGSSSSDLFDDDASSLSSSSSPPSSPRQSNEPLYQFSELMDQLPIKKGLSNFYQGKSQSFTSLAKVTNLEDLAKKETPYQRKLKACRSYGGDLNNFRSFTHPKAAISKKASKGSLSNLSCLSRKSSSFIDSCRPPLGPVQSSY